MGLQRYAFESVDDWVFDGTDEVCVERYDMSPRDYGEYYRVADVDALLASIRAALAAERAATAADTGSASGWVARITKARAALDALLADGGE